METRILSSNHNSCVLWYSSSLENPYAIFLLGQLENIVLPKEAINLLWATLIVRICRFDYGLKIAWRNIFSSETLRFLFWEMKDIFARKKLERHRRYITKVCTTFFYSTNRFQARIEN